MEDYTSVLLNAPEHNDIGSESNLERLEGRGLSGGRISYSNKSTSEAGESGAEHSLDQTSTTNTSSSTDTTDLITKTTTNTGVNATTVGTATAVGGVVVASVVIFTSILGNQFKLVDNSLTLSTYRNLDDNSICLDYAFDLQYDKTGEVYVKLLSAGHSLTSEAYELFYEYEEEYEPIEPIDGEDGEPIEKEKPVYTINISGTFENLIEKNEYSFVITSVIEGTESQIYTSKLYIPSSYVDVLENSVEIYRDKETENYNLFYSFFVSYETEAELYVELLRAGEDGNYVVEDTSEKMKLETIEEQADGNQFYYEFSGEFLDLVEYGDYIINLISNTKGFINTPYTSRFIAYEQHIVQSYFVDDDNFIYEVYYEDALTLQIEILPYEYLGGHFYFEIINIKTEEVFTTEEFDVFERMDEIEPVFAEIQLRDITSDYLVKVHSVVNTDDVIVYEKEIETSVSLGYLRDDISIRNVNNGSGNVYSISYSLLTDFAGETYFKVKKILTDEVVYTSETFDEIGNNSLNAYGELTGLDDGAAYMVEVYGNWGNDDVLVESQSFEAVEYGISVNSQGIVSDYEEETITIPITVSDRYHYLDQFMAYLTVGENNGAGGQDDEFVTEFNDESTSISFYVEGHTKGTYARLRLEAVDSNNNDATTVFVDMAIWY